MRKDCTLLKQIIVKQRVHSQSDNLLILILPWQKEPPQIGFMTREDFNGVTPIIACRFTVLQAHCEALIL